MADKRDYYEVLGVDKSADDATLKKAYRKLAKKYHPDSNAGNPQAEQMFKDVNEAYSILSDPEKKKLYDRFGHAAFDPNSAAYGGAGGAGASGNSPFGSGFGGTGQGGSWHYQSGPGGYAEYHFTGDDMDDMGDIFGDMFGGMFHGKSSGGSSRSRHFTGGSGFGGSGTHFTGGSSFGGSSAHFGGGSGFGGFGGSSRQANPNAPRKGQDIRVRITLSFDEAVHGCKKNITITRQQECTECHGSGCAAGSSPETCPDCGGRGYVIRQQRTPFGVMQTQQPCSRCGGKGKLVKNPCKVCHGSGKTAARKTLEVSIPMGIDDDQSFALRGMGDAGANGGPSGDVIVMVTVRPSEVFQRDGYDVWVTVPITYSQAVLGDSVTVPSIDGKVEYTVPEGTQSGTTFRLRGKGIQYLNGRGRGDMYVKCEVEIPKKLNKTQREALKKFEGTLKEENYEKRKGFFKKLKDMFNN